MRKIIKIEPTEPVLPRRKRVAAYARVSMECERLMHSMSAQISYYSELIQKNPEWEYAGVYADNFISGTETKKRQEFQRMISDCEKGLIDIILCKSISRFARNTVDLLETIRHLKDIGVEVRFEKENINSLSGDGELMLTILASFAQEESRSLSENVKWGIRKRFEKGDPCNRNPILGYEWVDDKLVVVPEEAEIVKRIFRNFLDGKSRLETERELNAEGITTKRGYRWIDSNIKVILTNITYTGNMLLQKEYITDPITKRRKKNNGELPKYYVENTHEAIIDTETWELVQELRSHKRRPNRTGEVSIFSGLLYCADCGEKLYYSVTNNYSREQAYFFCSNYRKNTANCTAHYIREKVVYALVLESLQRVLFYVQAFEKQFVQEQLNKSSEEQKKELAKKRRELAKSEKRIAELDVLFQRIYEDNVSGKLSDERFEIMSANYEGEQKTLKEALSQLKADIETQDDKTENVSAFIQKVKRYTEIKELTPAIVNEFINHILVSKKQVIDGKTVYPIDIYYNGVGIINAPSAEEYEEMFQERLKHKQHKEEKTV